MMMLNLFTYILTYLLTCRYLSRFARCAIAITGSHFTRPTVKQDGSNVT